MQQQGQITLWGWRQTVYHPWKRLHPTHSIFITSVYTNTTISLFRSCDKSHKLVSIYGWWKMLVKLCS